MLSLQQLIMLIAVMEDEEFMPVGSHFIESSRIITEPAECLLTLTRVCVFNSFLEHFIIEGRELAFLIMTTGVELVDRPELNLREEVFTLNLWHQFAT